MNNDNDFWNAPITFDGDTVTRRKAATRLEAAGVPVAETIAAMQAGAATFADGKWEPSTYERSGRNHKKGEACERHSVTGKARPLQNGDRTADTDATSPADSDRAALAKLPKADLIGLAYATALRIGGVTGDVTRRNINTMKKAELIGFIADFAAKSGMTDVVAAAVGRKPQAAPAAPAATPAPPATPPAAPPAPPPSLPAPSASEIRAEAFRREQADAFDAHTSGHLMINDIPYKQIKRAGDVAAACCRLWFVRAAATPEMESVLHTIERFSRRDADVQDMYDARQRVEAMTGPVTRRVDALPSSSRGRADLHNSFEMVKATVRSCIASFSPNNNDHHNCRFEAGYALRLAQNSLQAHNTGPVDELLRGMRDGVRTIIGNPFRQTPVHKDADAVRLATQFKEKPDADLAMVLADVQEEHGMQEAADSLRKTAERLRGRKPLADADRVVDDILGLV